jgi:integrase
LEEKCEHRVNPFPLSIAKLALRVAIRPERYGDRKKIMKKLCKKAGVRYFRFHPIRHAGASIMDSNNVPIGSIQRILGHENRKTTEIYLHSIGDSERNAMRVFEQAREKSHTESHTGDDPKKKGLDPHL